MFKFFAQTVVPFLGGSVVVMNLSRLVETNPFYEASWWKVWFAIIFSIVIPLIYRND